MIFLYSSKSGITLNTVLLRHVHTTIPDCYGFDPTAPPFLVLQLTYGPAVISRVVFTPQTKIKPACESLCLGLLLGR